MRVISRGNFRSRSPGQLAPLRQVVMVDGEPSRSTWAKAESWSSVAEIAWMVCLRADGWLNEIQGGGTSNRVNWPLWAVSSQARM